MICLITGRESTGKVSVCLVRWTRWLGSLKCSGLTVTDELLAILKAGGIDHVVVGSRAKVEVSEEKKFRVKVVRTLKELLNEE